MTTIQKDALEIKNLTNSELLELLTAEGELQQWLWQKARETRQTHLENQAVVRGVIEISNYCQKNCDYCAIRAVNTQIERYRFTAEEILAIAQQIAEAHIPIVFLQAGQDPQCDPILEEVIPEIKRRFNVNILLCLGERPKAVYERFAELGANSYILKFESSNPELYKQIAHTSLEKRLQCARWIQEAGLKLGTGNIVGLPHQTLDMLVDDIRLALEINPDFVSSSPFIPNQNTPLESLPYGNLNYTLNTMAIYRIALKTPLIPTVSALEKIQPGGQLMGFNAGANVITINFTPQDFQEKYLIYSQKRFVVRLNHALETLHQAGLKVDKLITQNYQAN